MARDAASTMKIPGGKKIAPITHPQAGIRRSDLAGAPAATSADV
jgi:hypothetical protein